MPGRGRGRGRGRGGRGRGRRGYGRGNSRQAAAAASASDVTTTATPEEMERSPHLLFTVKDSTFDQHLATQETNRNIYLASLQVLLKSGVDIPQGSKVRALAAAWARKDHTLAQSLLAESDHFTLAEVLKALMMLDAGRQVREKERRLRQLQIMIQDKGKVRPKKMSKVKSDIDNLNKTKPKLGSVSGALSRHIQRWVRGLSASELEFYALRFPKEPWKKIADICHLNPKKDFPGCPWFLPHCFGEPAPQDSLVARCASMSAANINEIVQNTDVPYTHIKQFVTSLTPESKARIAEYEKKVDTLLWYYEELRGDEVDLAICRRILHGEKVTLPTGKLLERMLLLKMTNSSSPVLEALIPEAEKRLKNMKLSLEAPVAILGDRSPSMDVAIRTSTIIAGIMTAITDAKLSFFSNKDYVPESLPKTISEVLEMASKLKTDGSTAPAASLWPYYERKEIIKTFVMVTDEEENCECNYFGKDNSIKFRFLPLFKKYRDEVYTDVKLVFISFLHRQHAEGQMVRELRREGIHPMQFTFDGHRPDLTKLDTILGLLYTATDEFRAEVECAAGKMAPFVAPKTAGAPTTASAPPKLLDEPEATDESKMQAATES
ncbi:uncharacterized protein [Diadema setosum]|uniref:uncharacterized protein n=1 Tax=Diadema setosum TaxID=31175 RepID=UPI003B3B44F5